MKHFVETGYLMLPRAAAELFDVMTSGQANNEQIRQIADDLCRQSPRGRVLDVGCGPGRLLEELARRRGDRELHGLELSRAMIALAARRLERRDVELRCRSVEASGYPDDHFDLVTCTGSLYIWYEPVRCLDEIYRILKPGGAAVLFETVRDLDLLALLRGFAAIFPRQGLLRGVAGPVALLNQRRMTYRFEQYQALAARSRFGDDHSLERITLAQLPMWVRIELRKPHAGQ